MEQEEAGEAELADQRELLVEPRARLLLVAVDAAVALLEGAVADAGELAVGGLVAVGEVGVAVAELLGQVEAEPLGELGGAGDGVAVVREALGDLGGCEQDGLVVAAPLGLAALERGVVADRDEHVLQRRARAGGARGRRR